MSKRFRDKGLLRAQEDLVLLIDIPGRVPGSYSEFIRENKSFFSHLLKAA